MQEGPPRERYKELHQTWDLIRPSGHTAPKDGAAAAPAACGGEEKARHRIQKLRIEKRLSVGQLAAAVDCDAETLAAFERGDEVLGAPLMRRLEQRLA